MIYSIAGLPSRFSEWCETVLRALITTCGYNPELLVADSLEKLGQQLLARDNLSAVVVTRQPSRSLCRELLAKERAPVVVLEEPGFAVGSLVEDYDVGYTEAVRRVANALTALKPLVAAESVLVLYRGDYPSPEPIVRIMADHFGLRIEDAAIDKIVREHPFRPAAAIPAEPFTREPSSRFGELTPPPCDQALLPLWQSLRGDPLGEIVWSPHLFFRSGAENGDAAEEIDLTGSGRGLIHGPYIRLPAGSWSCRMLFACNAEASGAHMLADIFGGAVLNSARFELQESGIFEIEFAFENADSDTPIEMRLFTAAAVFDGTFVLGHVRLTPLKAPRIRVN